MSSIETTSTKITKTDQGMSVTGELVFASITDFLEQGNQFIQQHKNNDSFVINCEAMQRIDSAGIALLIEWHRQCANNDKPCQFAGLTHQAKSLIETYRLESLITA